MKQNGHMPPAALALIILLTGLILWVGVAAISNQQAYRREASITPTPSITPRTVRITEDPSLPTSTPTPRILQVNSAGIEVKLLQQRLQELGFYNGALDGQYGSGTKTAVASFQLQHGLKNDGVAGELTLNLLYSENAQPFTATPTPSATPEISTLSSGSYGEAVKQLQQRLHALSFYSGAIDGDFGKGTKAAVKLFQQQHGLDADGIAGAQTLALLYSDEAKTLVVTPTPEAITVLSGSLPLLVNKEHPVGEDFLPGNLVNMTEYCDASLVKIKYDGMQGAREAVDALIEMLAAAKADGITNWQVSAAYRSYADQQDIFNSNVRNYMNKNGLSREKAISATRQTVADPGASEHHTGLAFDMTVPGKTFKYTDQCKWLHKHCWEYGFILRYTEEKQSITGFLAEAWHIRYVGVEHSLNMRDNGLCLEEYLQYATLQ